MLLCCIAFCRLILAAHLMAADHADYGTPLVK
jgi:hypothetical protein